MTKKSNMREQRRIAKHRRIRRKVVGASECPRLCVHRSLKNFYAQIIDDTTGKVLFGLSTRNKDVAADVKSSGGVQGATLLGEKFATFARTKGITKVCFDRGGYLYHGRIKAFADAARKNGLEF